MSHAHEASDPIFVPLWPGHVVGQAEDERKNYGQISQTERYERSAAATWGATEWYTVSGSRVAKPLGSDDHRTANERILKHLTTPGPTEGDN